MKRESFIFYKSYYDSIKELKGTEQLKLYNAIFQFQFENEEIELKGVCKSVFNLIRPLLSANNQRYLNGKKGGRPKNENETEKKPENNLNESKKKANEKVMNNVLCIMNNELCNMNNDNINKNINIINKENNKKKYFENDELNNVFLEFLDLRKKIKAINSERAINMLLKKLSNYDDDTKKKMIERSILNSWKDVYEIKQEKTSYEKRQQMYKELEEQYNEN